VKQFTPRSYFEQGDPVLRVVVGRDAVNGASGIGRNPVFIRAILGKRARGRRPRLDGPLTGVAAAERARIRGNSFFDRTVRG